MIRIVKSPMPPLACGALALAALAALGQSPPPNSNAARTAPAASSQPATPAPAPAAARTPSADDPSLRTPTQLSPEDLLKEFQKDRPRALPILPSGGPDEVVVERESPASSGGRRLPDGFFLVDRVGRLTRDGEWWVFVFEGYNDSHPEPPMRLLPNQLLERLVIESEGAGGSAVFVGSGEVTEFKGENYLLLRKLLLRRGLGNLEK